MSLARITPIIGSLYALLRNRLGLNVATPLKPQELSCTVAPDRRLVVLGHEPIAGFARDHGTVADEAAMLALHTLDSTTLVAEPTFVAPGDSCLRADDPGWRWHCIAGHGQTLSDWERRPLAAAVLGGLAGAQPLDADLTAIAAQGVSAWGLARLSDTDAAATKTALSLTSADISDASTSGRALMAVATPTEVSVPVISTAGVVTTTPISSLGSGGGSGMSLLYGDAFADLSSWGVVAGSWSVSDGVLSKTSTGDAILRLDVPATLYLSEVVVQVDMRLTATPAALTNAGVLSFWAGTSAWANSVYARLDATANATVWQTANYVRPYQVLIAGRTITDVMTAPAYTEWVTLTVRIVGAGLSMWINGTRVIDAVAPIASVNVPYYLGIGVGDAQSGTVQFRNFRLYAPSAPI